MSPPRKFPFAKLPPEVRQMIYKLSLPIQERLDYCDDCRSRHVVWRMTGEDCECEDCSFEHGVCPDHPAEEVELCDDKPLALVEKASDDPEPGFLQLARAQNHYIYQEALPFFYNKSIITVRVDAMDMSSVNGFLVRLKDGYGRSKMLGHLVVLFDGIGGWENPGRWLWTVENCLSDDCRIDFTGNEALIMAFCFGCTTGVRLRSLGLDWDVVEKALRDACIYQSGRCDAENMRRQMKISDIDMFYNMPYRWSVRKCHLMQQDEVRASLRKALSACEEPENTDGAMQVEEV
ncbi:MAG: hypothetical protein Q9162_002792 [Coniocarpon cinnabarinum]